MENACVPSPMRFTRFAIVVAWTMIGFLVAALASGAAARAADPSAYLPSGGDHRLLSSDMPPGYVGQARLHGRGAVNGYFQPVRVSGPEDVRFSLAQSGAFSDGREEFQAGLLIGGVYRFQISNIPLNEGAELYPTIELIDRTYPPPGLATRFPIEVRIDEEDILAALQGQMVTRVIYLEDPQTAVPLLQTKQDAKPIDIAEFQDPLQVADRFGRPMAILRIGSMAPPQQPELLPQFFFGYPMWAPIYQAEPATQ